MEGNTIFTYEYSAKQNKEVESIRRKYLPREESKLEHLKRLDNKAQSAGMLPSLCIGVIGILIFGIAMCFGLNVFEGEGWLKYFFGILGILTMLPAYPIYKYISSKTKARLTPEILRLTDELMAGL